MFYRHLTKKSIIKLYRNGIKFKKTKIIADDKTTKEIPVSIRIIHGDSLSPILVNMILDEIVR